MTKGFLTIIILMLLAIGCNSRPVFQDPPDSTDNHETKGEATSSRPEHLASNPSRQIPTPYFEPLRLDQLSEFKNPDFAYKWVIEVKSYLLPNSPEDSPRDIIIIFKFMPASKSVIGIAREGQLGTVEEKSYYARFDSTLLFDEVFAHIKINKDLFFDYSEYEGQEPGARKTPVGTGEYIHIYWYTGQIIEEGRVLNYSIKKGLPKGESEPAEVKFIIEKVKDALLPTLLQYPVIDGKRTWKDDPSSIP